MTYFLCPEYFCHSNVQTTTNTPNPDPTVLTTSASFSPLSISEDQIPQVIECPTVRYVRTFKFELEWCFVKNYSECNFCSSPPDCGTSFPIPGPVQCGSYEIENVPYAMASSTIACVGKSILNLSIYFCKNIYFLNFWLIF